MTTKPLAIGVLGDGPAATAYVAVASKLAGVTLISAAPELLLADPDIYGVIVDGSLATRAEAVRAALEQGKQVLVEAPMAGTLVELDELRQAASAAGVSLVVAQPWRRLEVYRSFRAAVDAGDLGPPAFFHWVSEGNRDWLDAGDLEAGPAVGATTGIDLALWLLDDPPDRVYARSVGADGVTISLRFRSGANALIEHRPRLAAPGARFGSAWLLGPRGEVRWDQAVDGLAVSGDSGPTPFDHQTALAGQLDYAIACWRGTIDSDNDLAVTRRLLAVIAAANESVAQGRPITITPDDAESGR